MTVFYPITTEEQARKAVRLDSLTYAFSIDAEVAASLKVGYHIFFNDEYLEIADLQGAIWIDGQPTRKVIAVTCRCERLTNVNPPPDRHCLD